MNKQRLWSHIMSQPIHWFILLFILCFFCATLTHARCLDCQRSFPTSTTDEDITTNILTRIAGDRALAYQWIKVSTYEQVVSLYGILENQTQARVAVCLAKSVPHVKAVRAKFKIKPHYDYTY